MESNKSACNDSFRNGTTRTNLVFHFCGRTSLADSGWIAGTGLRTVKHITHWQDKPLVTFYGDEGLYLSWLQSHCYFRDSVGIADVVGWILRHIPFQGIDILIHFPAPSVITSSIILPPRRKLFWNSKHSAIGRCSRTQSVYRENNSFCSSVIVASNFSSFRLIRCRSYRSCSLRILNHEYTTFIKTTIHNQDFTYTKDSMSRTSSLYSLLGLASYSAGSRLPYQKFSKTFITSPSQKACVMLTLSPGYCKWLSWTTLGGCFCCYRLYNE